MTGKYIPPRVYTIVEVKSGKGSEAGWIALSYAKRVLYGLRGMPVVVDDEQIAGKRQIQSLMLLSATKSEDKS